MAKSYVFIKDAPKMDYLNDFTSLPKNYGTKKYFNRPDIKVTQVSETYPNSNSDKENNACNQKYFCSFKIHTLPQNPNQNSTHCFPAGKQ